MNTSLKVPVSLEFFPPKTPEGVEKLRAVRAQLYGLKPEFCSVTYGAGGSTQAGTFATVQAILAEGGRERIIALLPKLADLDEWTAQSTEAVVRIFAEEAGLKLGQAAQPLRAALTGRSTSPGLFDVMAVLGKAECIARLSDAAVASPS